jgi:carbamoyltransferase
MKLMPAVIHVDGTARPQFISREDNPKYYDLLHEFERITGIPTLVNTSFNMHEEPIVCSPEEAISALLANVVDVLIIDDYLITPN